MRSNPSHILPQINKSLISRFPINILTSNSSTEFDYPVTVRLCCTNQNQFGRSWWYWVRAKPSHMLPQIRKVRYPTPPAVSVQNYDVYLSNISTELVTVSLYCSKQKQRNSLAVTEPDLNPPTCHRSTKADIPLPPAVCNCHHEGDHPVALSSWSDSLSSRRFNLIVKADPQVSTFPKTSGHLSRREPGLRGWR